MIRFLWNLLCDLLEGGSHAHYHRTERDALSGEK